MKPLALIILFPNLLFALSLAPDFMGLQSGGYSGTKSVGAGYLYADDQLSTFYSYGQSDFESSPIDQLNFKLQWWPLDLGYRNWQVSPVSLGLLLTYGLSDQLFLSSPDQFPEAQYYAPSALKGGFVVGGKVGRQWAESTIQSVSFYWEWVIMDTQLAAVYNNPGFFDFVDVVGMGYGLEIEF